jgi:hypothetical protein
MKKDDNGLGDALKSIMGMDAETETHNSGTTDPQRRYNGGTTEVQQTHKSQAARESKKIRLDGGDYEKLQEIATAEGTTAAALIRRAVKELIRRGGK